MTQDELIISAKLVGICIGVTVTLLGVIVGALLQTRFDFWKW